jgi:flagellar L-ring protein precursor FlgH
MIGPRLKWRFASLGLLGLLGAASLAGCSGEINEFMREPRLTPVGAGLVNPEVYGLGGALPLASDQPGPLPSVNMGNLYTDSRVTRVGDIVTVLIAINDKATFGNSMDRTRTNKNSFLADWNFVNNMLSSSSSSTSSSPQPSSVSGDLNSSSSTVGQGNIDRQEQIQVSVAAVVTDVLPNGNLVISGSQEVRVNYELRQLAVGGIIRPPDISPNNTVTYDRIAEARITYGGRGRLNDFQQPSWGQQVLDAFRPF